MAKFVELMLAVLQFQAEGLLTVSDILFASPDRIRKEFYRIPTYERQWFSTNWAELYRDRQQFYKRLHHLKRQGLVVKRGVTGKTRWVLTKRGDKHLEKYRRIRADPFSSAHTNFPAPKGEGITIIAFDIPEKERRKRGWLRMCLVEMGCEPLQKSVWMVDGGVSEDFMHALRERRLIGAVHIFAVTRYGTIKGIATAGLAPREGTRFARTTPRQARGVLTLCCHRSFGNEKRMLFIPLTRSAIKKNI